MEQTVPIPPLPPSPLFLPMEFWTEIMLLLDKKVRIMIDDEGYGKIQMSLVISAGIVKDVIFADEVRLRGLVEKAGPYGEIYSPKNQAKKPNA